MARQVPAAIRFNNPGAQYPGPSAKKFGSTGTEIIGGGHKIAVFDNPVDGAAAQFDLLDNGYAGMKLKDAIHKWSGGNSSPEYTNAIVKATGISPDTVLTKDMLRNPQVAIPLAKTAADWEAGGAYPMSNEQWAMAHAKAFGGTPQTYAPQQQLAEAAPTSPTSSPLVGVGEPTAAPDGPLASLMSTMMPGQTEQDPKAEKELMKLASSYAQSPQTGGVQIQPVMQRQLDLSKLKAMLANRKPLGTMGA